ncbi:cell division protein FtsL [uncultured Selenomonas sp.]|uniref:cell division protein FtsL n=1 Tax=uncultured Selenomonas sp. TaxID=159275 RepID=UPI0025D7CAE4|nr:cell division protein FtsL [uncultured Selenomonas sp.]
MPASAHKYYEEYEEPAARAPRPKRPPRPRVMLNQKWRSRLTWSILIVAVLALALTMRAGLSANRGYALVKTQQQAAQIEQENERLKIDIAKLKSPKRIKDIATSRLGMEVPQNVYFTHKAKTQQNH